jgi:hypothetical protein
MESNLENFIKDTLLILSCSNNIDHRNYNINRETHFSRLKKLAKNNSLDNSINIIVKEIIEKKILELTEKDNGYYDEETEESNNENYIIETEESNNVEKEAYDEKTEEEADNVEKEEPYDEETEEEPKDDDTEEESFKKDQHNENEDVLYDKNDEIFNKFIDYVGLYEMYNLHSDDRDTFKHYFIKIISK